MHVWAMKRLMENNRAYTYWGSNSCNGAFKVTGNFNGESQTVSVAADKFCVLSNMLYNCFAPTHSSFALRNEGCVLAMWSDYGWTPWRSMGSWAGRKAHFHRQRLGCTKTSVTPASPANSCVVLTADTKQLFIFKEMQDSGMRNSAFVRLIHIFQPYFQECITYASCLCNNSLFLSLKELFLLGRIFLLANMVWWYLVLILSHSQECRINQTTFCKAWLSYVA